MVVEDLVRWPLLVLPGDSEGGLLLVKEPVLEVGEWVLLDGRDGVLGELFIVREVTDAHLLISLLILFFLFVLFFLPFFIFIFNDLPILLEPRRSPFTGLPQ